MILALVFAATAVYPTATIPKRAGQCGWVRGRFAVYNGSGINRIWVVGSGHLLALYDNDQNVPRAIWRLWNSDKPFERELWGEFYVCARERWIKGHMQHVRIRATRRTLMR